MEVANVRMRLNKIGHDVPIDGVTPAEAMLLHILHGPENGGNTFGEKFENIQVVGQALVKVDGKQAERSDVQELARLRAKYAQAKNKKNEPIVNSVWPNALKPELPKTFKEIKWNELLSTGSSDVVAASVDYITGSVMTPVK